ncbi:MAG: TRAP transporter TatT component family protein [Pseudomonadota bacterium]
MLIRLLTLIFFVSCSGVDYVAVRTTSAMLYRASNHLELEGNWDKFREGTPANLIFFEGLYSLSPTNAELLTSLIKGHAAYAYAVYETLLLEDKFKGQEFTENRKNALEYYSKAMTYGLEYLRAYDINYSDLMKLKDSQLVNDYLEDKLGDNKEKLEAVFFIAQALGGLVNLQKEKPAMLAQIPVVKGMFDWACGHRPDFYWGACDLFYATYMAQLPASLGGKPQEAKEKFLKAIEKYPENWLTRVNYLTAMIIPQQDKKGLEEQFAFLQKDALRFNEQQLWNPLQSNAEEQVDQMAKHLNFYRSVAIKRFLIMQKYQKTLF